MKFALRKNCFDKRINSRRLYSGSIFFTAKTGFYEGRLKNYSRHGLFIETKARLPAGEIIIIALPHLKGQNIKCKGQIIWRNSKGFGIELFRRRSNTNLRII